MAWDDARVTGKAAIELNRLVYTSKCARCGRPFLMKWPVDRYAWKHSGKIFCSYSCFMANERERVQKKRAKKEKKLEREAKIR